MISPALFHCLLVHPVIVSTGSVSLYIYATYIVGETPFPEFSAVLRLNDVQVGYYDSAEGRLIPCGHNSSEDLDIQPDHIKTVFGDVYNNVKDRTIRLKPRLNYTDEFLVYQKIVGCEVKTNNTGLMRSWDSFNGINVEEVNISMPEKTLQRKSNFLYEWDREMRSYSKKMVSDLYYPVCVKNLKKYFHKEKNGMLSEVKPSIWLLKKTLRDSGQVRVTCLATGFYPRHINLTLLRKGQPVSEDQIIRKMLLPNGDGTYQMRKSLEVSEEELRQYYNCTATHLYSAKDVNIGIGHIKTPTIVYKLSGVLVAVVFLLVIVVVAGVMIWRKIYHRRGAQSPNQNGCNTNATQENEPLQMTQPSAIPPLTSPECTVNQNA